MRPAFFLIIFLYGSLLWGGEYSSLSGAEALNLETGARPAGLGKAFTAMADDPQALFYNPAGLGLLSRPGVSISHTALFSELSAQSVLGSYPLGPGSAGLGISYVHSGTFSEIVNGQETGNPIGYSSFLFLGGYGMRISRMIHAGLEVKFLSADLAGNRGAALALDAGILAGLEAGKFYDRIENNLTFGLSFQNYGTRIRYIEASERLPEKIRAGISYKPFSFACLAADVHYWTGYGLSRGSLFCAGLELLRDFFISPRLGLSLCRGYTEFTAGAGAGAYGNGLRYRLDLAYSGAGDLGSRIFLTLTLREEPFYQYRSAVVKPVEEPLPDLSAGEARPAIFSASREGPEKLKIRQDAAADGTGRQEDLEKEFAAGFKAELEKSKTMTAVSGDEDVLITHAVRKENGKYRLDVHVRAGDGKTELKRYLVRFTASGALAKISRRIADSVERNVLPSLFPEVRIRTFPRESALYVRDTLLGKTPYAADRLPAGGHSLRIVKKGYRTLVTNVSVRQGVPNDFEFTLRPEIDIPDRYNLTVKNETPSGDTEDLSQAFEMLLAGNLELFGEVAGMDAARESDLKIGYSFKKGPRIHILELKIVEIKSGRVIGEMKYSMEKDEKLVEAVNSVLGSVVEFAARSKREAEASGKAFLRVRALSPDLEVFLDERMIPVPFEQAVAGGRHSLEVRRGEDLLFSRTVYAEAGATNSVLLFRKFREDFSDGPDGRLWESGGSGEIRVSKGRLMFSSGKGEKKELVLKSRELPSVPFEVSVKLRSKNISGSEFYFGVMDDVSSAALIRYDHEAYSALLSGAFSGKGEEHGLITRFGDEEKREHELKVKYRGARILFYADGLLIRDLPLSRSEGARIVLAAVSRQGMLFAVSDLRLNLLPEGGL